MADFNSSKNSSTKDNLAESIFDFPKLYRIKVNLISSVANHLRFFWFRNYFDPIDVIANELNNKKVIELGCGDGYLYSQIKKTVRNMQYFGSDINDHMIDHCISHYPECKWLCFKSLPYPFNDNEFDVVLIWNVLHHLNDYDDVLALLIEALRIGKRVVLLEPAQSNPSILKHLKSLHWKITDGGKYYFTHSDWKKTFKKIGAEVEWEKISEPLNQIYMAEIRKAI